MQNLTCQNKARVNIQFGEAMNIAHFYWLFNSPNVVFNLNNYKNTSINSVQTDRKIIVG